VEEPRGFEPPASSAWFDMEHKTEHVLGPGERPPSGGGDGFLWVDLELSEPGGAAALVERGLLPAGVLEEDRSAGEVGWELDAGQVHLALAGARLDGDALALDRRHIVITAGVVATVHRGVPDHFDRVRARYRDSFAAFAQTHGFLLFELCGALVDDLQGAVRDLGHRIDELRLATVGGAPTAGTDPGADLLGAVLLTRHVLVRTRDLFMELSSRRVALVPETTQPYIRDMAGRLDGLVDDLAFSRDVLSEAMRAVPAHEALPSEPEPAPAPAVARGSLAESLLAAGQPSEALAHFEALLDDDPEQESWHRGIMRCHAVAGDRALALRQFHTCRSVLRQSQGVDPSPETQALYLELLRAGSG